MIKLLNERNCLTCNKSIKGRSDKKFCDDYCRNTYNNHLKADTNIYIRNINSALRKNRRILHDLMPDDAKVRLVHKEVLYSLGFQFRYHTHNYTNKEGKTYTFCYDFGYFCEENEMYLIVKK